MFTIYNRLNNLIHRTETESVARAVFALNPHAHYLFCGCKLIDRK